MSVAAQPVSAILAAAGWAASLPARLVGPIFTKELRVSSRRRRNYVLRGVYLAALTLFVVLIYLATVRWDESGSYAGRIRDMVRAGKTIISSVVWFQFCVVQLVTVVMLSNSISEEVYHRTLGVLMTTPIHSAQIVIGKLLSKMLQLVTLLAMSLPLLAIVRVLGGVPWDYVIAGICLTLSTSVFIAAVTMFYSILFRRAFVSILLSLGTLLALYMLVPMLIALVMLAMQFNDQEFLQGVALPVILHGHPYYALGALTVSVFEPRAGAMISGGIGFHWWINCAVMLALAAGVLSACVAMVRRAALRQAAGATGAGPSSAPPAPAVVKPPIAVAVAAPAAAPALAAPEPPAPAAILQPVQDAPAGPVRPLRGSPVIWRELRAPMMRRRLLLRILLGVGALMVIAIYALVAAIDHGTAWTDSDVHAVFLCAEVILSTVATAILAATGITAEKEAGSWHLLLSTTLTDRQIVLGKLVGVLRRCLPVWLLPIGHVLLFVAIRVFWMAYHTRPPNFVHPILLLYTVLIMVSVVGLLAGAGLYFGARFKRTTTAVIMNLSLAIALWAAVPGLLALATEVPSRWGIRRTMEDLTEYTIDANPVYQAVMLAERTCGRRAQKDLDEMSYYWEAVDARSFGETLAFLAACSGGYVAVGAFLAWSAKRRCRRKVF